MPVFKADQMQVVWFLNGLGTVDRLEFAKKLIEASQNSLDGDPAIIPLPQESPIEGPLIILRSKDETLQLNVTQTRVDFFARTPNVRAEHHRLALPLDKLNALADVLRAGSLILRQAIVSLWVAEPEGGGTAYIRKNYLQSDPLVQNATNTEVHLLHKIHFASVPCNRWIRLRSLARPENLKTDYLSLLVDINSVAEKAQAFDRKLTAEFLGEAAEHTREIILALKP